MTVSLTRKEASWGWRYMLFQLLVLPELLRLVAQLPGVRLDTAAINLLYFSINFLAVLLICGRFLLENLFSVTLGRLLACAGVGLVAYWLLSFAVTWLILLIYPDFYNVNDASVSSMADSNFLLTVIGTVVLVPVAEEVFYRGILFGTLYRIHKLLGYAVSILVFALIHVMQYVGSYPIDLLALCLLQYLPAGLCLAVAYEKSDSILCPILMHTVINAIGVYAMR